MSEMDAIRSATVVTAEMLGQENRLGTIEPGKLADLVAVAGNPLDDITELQRIRTVIRNGVLVE
jgi:imidazolonepropionase-like amidohydrolase